MKPSVPENCHHPSAGISSAVGFQLKGHYLKKHLLTIERKGNKKVFTLLELLLGPKQAFQLLVHEELVLLAYGVAQCNVLLLQQGFQSTTCRFPTKKYKDSVDRRSATDALNCEVINTMIK